MHGVSSTGGMPAIPSSDRNAEKSRKSVSDDENWFSDMAKSLLAKPGLELHLITGIEERSCHRYASGEVKNPPAFFLRSILRSPQGAPFLAYLMDGCEAEWWHDMQREIEAGRELLGLIKRMG